MEPHDRGPSTRPRLQNRPEETGHNDSVHCEQDPGRGMLKLLPYARLAQEDSI